MECFSRPSIISGSLRRQGLTAWIWARAAMARDLKYQRRPPQSRKALELFLLVSQAVSVVSALLISSSRSEVG